MGTFATSDPDLDDDARRRLKFEQRDQEQSEEQEQKPEQSEDQGESKGRAQDGSARKSRGSRTS